MADDLDRARAVKAHLERLASAEQKKVDQLEGQQRPGRGTSAAKHYDPAALGRVRSARDQFQRAASGQQREIAKAAQKPQPDRQREGVGRAPTAPGMHNRPQNPSLRNRSEGAVHATERGKFHAEQDRKNQAVEKQHAADKPAPSSARQAQERQAEQERQKQRDLERAKDALARSQRERQPPERDREK